MPSPDAVAVVERAYRWIRWFAHGTHPMQHEDSVDLARMVGFMDGFLDTAAQRQIISRADEELPKFMDPGPYAAPGERYTYWDMRRDLKAMGELT